MIGYDCRIRNVKQNPWNPTERRHVPGEDLVLPGPGHYDQPPVYGGKGYSKIKRAPAYTFGHRTPIQYTKPQVSLNAPQLNTEYLTRKGKFKIPLGIIGEKCSPPEYTVKIPGPGQHAINEMSVKRNPPAYSMRIAAKPPYEPFDMWTPSPNMYLPPIMSKKAPAYSLQPKRQRPEDRQEKPGPGEHAPKFDYVKRSKPAFSIGYPLRKPAGMTITPSPNEYCPHKFNYVLKRGPAPTFGIKHSPYIGTTKPRLISMD